MDVEFVDFENRPGYYKDEYGNWQPERREMPDRRGEAPASASESASRKTARRKIDRDVLKFLGIKK